MARPTMPHENRSLEQLRQHYEVEKELAHELRVASKRERRHLYSSLYDELYRRVPLHPQLARKSSPEESRRAVDLQLRFLRRFLEGRPAFLEIGPGDCALSLEVAKVSKQVCAVDVSDEITRGLATPPNFRLAISDGSSVPVPQGSVDVAYSNQVMEHLHPEDAREQIENIFRSLAPGGIYVCVTPNRLSGPHDVSAYFDREATGFHLHEYTTSELARLFKQVGFSRVRAYLGAKGRYVSFPIPPIAAFEFLLLRLPFGLRRTLVRNLPLRLLMGIQLVGTKRSEVIGAPA